MLNERARFRLHHPIGTISQLIEAPAGAPRVDIAVRAIAAFQRTEPVFAGPVWEPLLEGPQRDLTRWLSQGDADALAIDLAALGRSEAAQGFFGGAGQHRRCAGDPAFAQLLAVWTHDKTLSLAEAVGAVRMELPENGAWGETIMTSAADLLAAIEAKLGVDLSPPEHIGAYLGLKAGNRVLQMRVLEAIYAAWRLKQLVDEHGFTTVCEIGAGAGLTAYYGAILGIPQYMIIDLPTMNAVQAYMLVGSRVGDGVVLNGEAKEGTIQILPPDAFSRLEQGSVDLLFNQDSLPEIELVAARAYLADARRIGVRQFLSINQEAHLPVAGGHQISVAELAADVGGFASRSRHRHWLRQGYAEELYALEPLSLAAS